MKLLHRIKHWINGVRKLFRSYWLHIAAFFFHVQSGVWPSNKHSVRQSGFSCKQEERREDKLPGSSISKTLWMGAISLLWSQSHNLKQSAIPVKLCLPHFFIIDFYSSNCCSLLLWHTVAHLSLSLCLPMVFPSPLIFSSLAKSACFCMQSQCCNSSKCPHYQYFIWKYISFPNSSQTNTVLHSCYEILMRALSLHWADMISAAEKIGDFHYHIIVSFK